MNYFVNLINQFSDYFNVKYTTKAEALSAVQSDGFQLQHASIALKNDREVVMAAVEKNGWALAFASDALKADREFVMAVVKENFYALHYVSYELRADRDIVMAAVEKNGWALAFVSDALKADREVVMAVVTQDGIPLQFASYELRADRDIVMAAVEKNGWALQYASDELRADRDIVMAAVKENFYALHYVSYELRANREFVMAVVKEDGRALAYASETLRNDPDIALVAVKQFCYALRYASERTRDKMKIIFIGSELVKDKSFLKDLFAIDVNVARYLEIQKEITYDLLNKVSNIHQYREHDRILTEQSSASSELALNAESEYIMPKLMGSYNQLCEMIYLNAYNNSLDNGILKSKLPSQLTIADEVIQKMLEFLSYADLVNLQFLATNRFVEEKNDLGEVIKRLPKLENEWKDAKGDKYATITEVDRQLGIQTFFRRKDINGPTELCNHARHRQ